MAWSVMRWGAGVSTGLAAPVAAAVWACSEAAARAPDNSQAMGKNLVFIAGSLIGPGCG